MSKSRETLQKPIDHVVQRWILRTLWQKIQEDTDGTWLGDKTEPNLDILDPRIEVTMLSSAKRHKQAGDGKVVKREREQKAEDMVFDLGVRDKWLQRLGEGFIADVALKENKDGADGGNKAHLEILRIILIIRHCLGHNDEDETCGLDGLAESLPPTFSGKVLHAVRAKC